MIDFKKYDRKNPLIWRMFKKFAFRARVIGYKTYSSNRIFEQIRGDTGVSGSDQYKINNIYRPDYARKFMIMYPDYKGFFRTRETKALRS